MYRNLTACPAQILAERYAERCSVEDFSYARIRGHQWEFPGTERYQRSVEGVVLAYRITRIWWDGTPIRPRCLSADGFTGIDTTSCLGCSNNQFGTRGKGKACTEYRMVFFLEDEQEEPTLLVVPPTSLSSVRQYIHHFPDPAALSRVVTAFTVVSTEGSIGRVVGTMQRPLRAEEIILVHRYRSLLLPLLEHFTPVDGKKLHTPSR